MRKLLFSILLVILLHLGLASALISDTSTYNPGFYREINFGETVDFDAVVFTDTNYVDVKVLLLDQDGLVVDTLFDRRVQKDDDEDFFKQDNLINYFKSFNVDASMYQAPGSYSIQVLSHSSLGEPATGSLTLQVTNQPPVAVDDEFSVDEDSFGHVFDVLGNDFDPDGQQLSISSVSHTFDGQVGISNNKITYTPNQNFFGTEILTYQITDGAASSQFAEIKITVNNLPDAPGFLPLNDVTRIEGFTEFTHIQDLNSVALDLDDESLTFSASTSGSSAVCEVQDVALVIKPGSSPAGTSTCTVTADDGSLTGQISFQIIIQARDDDNDGVIDRFDDCLNTPLGQAVDANGCSESQKDDDDDGVKNDIDQCPNTPDGESVNALGCSESQIDDDDDGVMNNVDLCPNTPLGQAVDQTGCAESQKDDDQDNVFNTEDLCPDTPVGQAVDDNGCSLTQKDTDQDGINDALDLCADTTLNEGVNTQGCSCSQIVIPFRECPDNHCSGSNRVIYPEDGSDSCENGIITQEYSCEAIDEVFDPMCHDVADDDSDGVQNKDDLCPNTIQGEPVDVKGCSFAQRDDDNDGVVNGDDSCPNTLPGKPVDSLGCADHQIDTDDDGIFNDLDHCDNSPAGVSVSEKGCAQSEICPADYDDDGPVGFTDFLLLTQNFNQENEDISLSGDATVDFTDFLIFSQVFNEVCTNNLDQDNDGVKDHNDQCPNTPGNEQVDQIGCSDTQKDDDDDGKNNAIDQCPNTPTGEGVNEQGCGCSQIEIDFRTCPTSQCEGNNFVTYPESGFDQCVNGEIVQTHSCEQISSVPDIQCTALLDDDNDGVNNVLDLCPFTVSGPVDANGCSQLEICQVDFIADGTIDSLDYIAWTEKDGLIFGNSEFDPRYDLNNNNLISSVDGDLLQSWDGFQCFDNLDDDNDGIRNKDDQCSNTPVAEQADSVGCSESQKDDDDDGVNNVLDQCPNTPANQPVDSVGCSFNQQDQDNDGVINGDDQCPDTPQGESVDQDGCSQVQVDQDLDGVLDTDDQCPNTPQGESVDQEGCSQMQVDQDLDGVKDEDDLCPDTDSIFPVDANGCAPEQLDDDGDSVSNALDQCRDTPVGESVSEKGCGQTDICKADFDVNGIVDSDDFDIWLPHFGEIPTSSNWDPIYDFDGSNQVDFADQLYLAAVIGLTCQVNEDDDGDGVRNGIDQCADTTQGAPVDEFGCSADQRDSDDDGIFDSSDSCMNTPANAQIDSLGCSQAEICALDDNMNGTIDRDDFDAFGSHFNEVPSDPNWNPYLDLDGSLMIDLGDAISFGSIIGSHCQANLDTDQDGIIDTDDQCPNTPDNEPVDQNGCSDSQMDQDDDGVDNANDICPDTPSGEGVNSNGCGCSQLDLSVTCSVDACVGLNYHDYPASGSSQCENGLIIQTHSCEPVITTNANACQPAPDDDNDGVPNSDDDCSNTPNGEGVNSDGCSCSQITIPFRNCQADRCEGHNFANYPNDGHDTCVNGVITQQHSCGRISSNFQQSCFDSADDDNDGVNNKDDQCANTPGNEQANAQGCSASQRDTDGDGHNDNVDNCPTVSNPGQQDADGDSIGDACDNNNPVAADIPTSVNEDNTLIVSLSCSDVDPNPTFTYSIDTTTANGVLTLSGDQATYTPNANYHGPDSFLYRCSDQTDNSNLANVTITVIPVNDAPTFTSTPALGATEGVLYQYDADAIDVDGDTITFSIDTAPLGATIDSSTGVFSWTPDFAAVSQTNDVVLEISDGTLITQQSFSITVLQNPGINHAPILDPIGDKDANETELLSFSISATDPDGDLITYTVSGLPPGATFDSSLTFSWTPDLSAQGDHFVTFSASDGTLSSSETITITVDDRGSPPVPPKPVVPQKKSRLTISNVDLPSVRDYRPGDLIPVTITFKNDGSVKVTDANARVALYDRQFYPISYQRKIALNIPPGKTVTRRVYVRPYDDLETNEEYFIRVSSKNAYTRGSVSQPVQFS